MKPLWKTQHFFPQAIGNPIAKKIENYSIPNLLGRKLHRTSKFGLDLILHLQRRNGPGSMVHQQIQICEYIAHSLSVCICFPNGFPGHFKLRKWCWGKGIEAPSPHVPWSSWSKLAATHLRTRNSAHGCWTGHGIRLGLILKLGPQCARK